jgi:hypothetical protein
MLAEDISEIEAFALMFSMMLIGYFFIKQNIDHFG